MFTQFLIVAVIILRYRRKLFLKALKQFLIGLPGMSQRNIMMAAGKKAKADFLADLEKRRAEQDSKPAQPSTVTVTVDGQSYKVDISYDGKPVQQSSQNAPAASASDAQSVLSPLEGKFMLSKSAGEPELKVGDKVSKGDVVCYIEAMKTYNAICSEFSGTVTEICMRPGDNVFEDDVLIKIA